MPPVLIAKLLATLFVSLFGPTVLKNWGISLPTADNTTQGTVEHYQPAASAATPAAKPVAKPTTSEIAKTFAENPGSMWGLAVFGGFGIFLFAQLRAGAHELGSAAVATYGEATKAANVVSNADATTGNLSRFKK